MSTGGGFLLIDKPRGVSSFSVVRRIRSILSARKAGHAGTLDPQADGLLVLAFGKATRLIRYLPLEPKVYEFNIQFGSRTDTLDADGTVVESGCPLPAESDVAAVLPHFTGTLMQVPPAYSALKIDGKRSYDLARRGTPPVLQPREITIGKLSLLRFDAQSGTAALSITCSGGTYVRAIARDIAAKIGTIGFASAIRRTGCGTFSVTDAHTPEQVDTATRLITPAEAFASQPAIQASGEMIQAVLYGREVTVENLFHTTTDRIMLFCGNELIAVLRKTEGMRFHPDLVLATAAEVEHACS